MFKSASFPGGQVIKYILSSISTPGHIATTKTPWFWVLFFPQRSEVHWANHYAHSLLTIKVPQDSYMLHGSPNHFPMGRCHPPYRASPTRDIEPGSSKAVEKIRRWPVDMVTIPWEYRGSPTCQVVGLGISGCHQQMDLKMDGWKTIVSFLGNCSGANC